jgi:hypothetical protein
MVQLPRTESVLATQLIEDIVDKAEGVFLWVTFLKSLLNGLMNTDGISKLQKTLDCLAPDL